MKIEGEYCVIALGDGSLTFLDLLMKHRWSTSLTDLSVSRQRGPNSVGLGLDTLDRALVRVVSTRTECPRAVRELIYDDDREKWTGSAAFCSFCRPTHFGRQQNSKVILYIVDVVEPRHEPVPHIQHLQLLRRLACKRCKIWYRFRFQTTNYAI